jgi:hypothetical protein
MVRLAGEHAVAGNPAEDGMAADDGTELRGFVAAPSPSVLTGVPSGWTESGSRCMEAGKK